MIPGSVSPPLLFGIPSIITGQWSQQEFPVSDSWNAATYANGKYVVLAYGSDTGYWSSTGLTGSWTAFTLPAARGWQSVQWNGTIWLAVADDGNSAYSANLVTWAGSTIPFSG